MQPDGKPARQQHQQRNHKSKGRRAYHDPCHTHRILRVEQIESNSEVVESQKDQPQQTHNGHQDIENEESYDTHMCPSLSRMPSARFTLKTRVPR